MIKSEALAALGAGGAEYFTHAHVQPFSPARGWTS